MVALPLVPIVIGGAIKLAAPHVAKFLVKHGFKKASQTAVKGKTKIPKVSSKQAKDIVNKDQQTSFSLSKDISKKDIQKMKDRLGTSDQVSVYDKDGKLVGRYLDMKTAKKLKPGHRYTKEGQKELKKKFPKAIQEEEDVLKNVQAEDLTTDPELQKFLKSGKRKMKRGGQVGVGAALRGYGATRYGD